MLQLLLIDVALCALLVAIAGGIMVLRRRRRRSQARARAEKRRTALGLAGDGTAGRETAVVPGFGDDPVGRDPGARAPAGTEQTAEPQASAMTGPAPAANGQRAQPDRPEEGPSRPAAELNGRGAKPQGTRAEPVGPRAGQVEPRADPSGRPAVAGAATPSDRISSYYDEADQPMSDYLAAMGWAEEPETRHTG